MVALIRRSHADLDGDDLFDELLLLNQGNRKQTELDYARVQARRKQQNAKYTE